MPKFPEECDGHTKKASLAVHWVVLCLRYFVLLKGKELSAFYPKEQENGLHELGVDMLDGSIFLGRVSPCEKENCGCCSTLPSYL